jgi:thiol-disulfide isomerase/thioredoxin
MSIRMVPLPISHATSIASLRSGGPALLFVHATWCSYCRAATPMLEKVAMMLGSAVPTYSIDADQLPHLVKSLGVKSFPTILYVSRHGIHKFEAERSPDTIAGFVCQHASSDGSYDFCGSLLR